VAALSVCVSVLPELADRPSVIPSDSPLARDRDAVRERDCESVSPTLLPTAWLVPFPVVSDMESDDP
jgi:hypothetical protein